MKTITLIKIGYILVKIFHQFVEKQDREVLIQIGRDSEIDAGLKRIASGVLLARKTKGRPVTEDDRDSIRGMAGKRKRLEDYQEEAREANARMMRAWSERYKY